MISIREYLNLLLINNLSYKDIIFLLWNKISKEKKLSMENKIKCMKLIVESEKNYNLGYREIHHLEYCIIRIINLLKNNWLDVKKI